MRRLVPDQFHSLVKMHLSFLTDLKYDDCDCNFVYETTTPSSTPSKSKGIFSGSATPRRSKNSGNAYKGVMEGAPLTMEGVCQVSQIIEYLKRNLHIEGLFRSVKRIQCSTLFKIMISFRKCGNLKKQQTLKERLNKGIPTDLDTGEFSVHECASTLKSNYFFLNLEISNKGVFFFVISAFLSDLSEPLLTDAYYNAVSLVFLLK